MKEDILDKIEGADLDNKNQIIKLILLIISTIIFYFLLEKLRSHVPENLIDHNGTQVKTIGLIIVGVIVFLSITIAGILNKIEPQLNKIQVVAYTGLIFFVIEFLFKLTQSAIIFGDITGLDYFQVFKFSTYTAIIGMLMANIRIHRIRKKKTLIPTLLLIGVWALLAFMMKAYIS